MLSDAQTERTSLQAEQTALRMEKSELEHDLAARKSELEELRGLRGHIVRDSAPPNDSNSSPPIHGL